MEEFQSVLDYLGEVYKQSYRKYHNWNHIQYMLNRYYSDGGTDEALYFAILFHDFIYNPLAKDNESRSAEIAYRWLTEKICRNSMIAERTSQLIVEGAKIDNFQSKDDLLIKFIKYDFGIFAEDEVKYSEYKKNIRAEYVQFVSEKTFVANRYNWLVFYKEDIYKLFGSESVLINLEKEVEELKNEF